MLFSNKFNAIILILLGLLIENSRAFVVSSSCNKKLFTTTTTWQQRQQRQRQSHSFLLLATTDNDNDLEYLKTELSKYLIARKKQVKEDDEEDDDETLFDYDELERLGFGYLCNIIIDKGGRYAMYDLMKLDRPTSKIDFSTINSNDGQQSLFFKDENEMAGQLNPFQNQQNLGQDLERYNKDQDDVVVNDVLKENVVLLPQKEKDEFSLFPGFDSSKNKKKNKYAPDWTPERLDEALKQRGRATEWKRQALAGTFITDPFELWVIEGSLRYYSSIMLLIVALAFGRVTSVGLGYTDGNVLQGPALALVLANIGSAVWGYLRAPEKKRNPNVWAFKGLLGGPLAIVQLKSLDVLVTRLEKETEQSNLKEQRQQVLKK